MQRCKYPIKTMNITQSYTGTYSHSKNYNGSPRDYPIDDNCGTTGRSYFYAPFDCSIKRIYGVGAKGTNTIWIQSQAPVQTPSFTDYETSMVIHPNDDKLRKLKVGKEFRQAADMFLETTAGLPGITSIFLRGAAERRATDGSRTPEEPGSWRLQEEIIRRKKSSISIRRLQRCRERRDCSSFVPAWHRQEMQDHPLPREITELEPR